MRRTLLGIAAALALLSFAPRAEAQSVVVGVGGELSALPGDEIRVPVFVNMAGVTGEMLGSYTVRITWDPDVLFYQNVYAGPFASPTVNTDSVFLGILWITAVNASGMDGLFNVAEVSFGVSFEPIATTIDITATELSAATTFTNLLLPGVTYVTGSFCPALGRWGDVSVDVRVNSRDALAILSYIVGIPIDSLFTIDYGDVDGDGAVNSRDALIILSYAVGIEIPGQRVLVVIPGACATGDTETISVLPLDPELVVGQSVFMLVQLTDAAGNINSVPGLNWASDDPSIAFVDNEGFVVGRTTGTTTLRTEIGPGIGVETTVTVIDRRIHWVVDAAKAALSPIQLGTPEWPMASPEFAFPLLAEGDTIWIEPGVHDYFDVFAPISVGAVIIGRMLPDGTRPVLRAPENDFITGFDWIGGDNGVVQDLVLRGFYIAIYGSGVRNLRVENVTVEEPVTPFRHGRGVYISGIDTLRVLFSEFLGSPDLHSYEAIRVWNGADLVEILNTTATYWEYEAIDLYNVMQLDMRDSEVSFNRQEGVYMSVGGGGGNEYPTNARFYRNRLIDNRFEGLDINYAGLIELQHNFIETSYFEAIDIFGFFPIRPESKLTMLGDTIDSYVDDDYYIYIIRMDSILVDSLQFYNSGDYEDSRWDGNYVGITNSTFDGITGYTIDSDARDFVLDNSVFTGCSTCTRDADAVMVDPLSDSLLTVWITNNTFTNVFEALDVAWLGDSTGVFTVTGNTIDSAFTGMRLYSDSLVVQNNTLTGIDNYGIRTLSPEVVGRTRMTSGISNNSVTCSPGRSATGIRVDYQPAHIANNTVTDCFYGIHAFNRVSGLDTFDLMVADNTVISDQSPGLSVGIWQDGGNYRWSFLRNKVKFGDTGIRGAVAVENTVLIADSNVTQETTAVGFRISGTSATSSVVARWNNITNNLAVGLLHTATSPVAFNLGRFVGNGTFGVTAGIGASTIDATQNWWGAVGGSGAVGADTVTGAVNTGSPLASDPTTTVPPAFAPPGFAPNFAFRGTPADRELRPVAGPDNERPRRVREADDDDDSDRAARHAAADAEAQRIREARRQRQGDRPVRPPR